MARQELHVIVLAALSPDADPAQSKAFAKRVIEDALPELEEATRAKWCFEFADPTHLADDEPRRPTEFLDEASLRIVEGPYDAALVVTDVGLVARRRAVVAGLASPVSRLVVLSTRKLLVTPRGQPMRTLEDVPVRANAARLLLHLLGHLLGLRHAKEGAMAPYYFDAALTSPPPFGARQRARLARLARRAPERELVGRGPLRALAFHVVSAARHPRLIGRAVLRSRAPLLALSLPGLLTAATVPTLILVVTSETWDVGLNMGNGVAAGFALASLAAATAVLAGAHHLFYPRKEKRVVTQHMAVVNVTILLTVLVGLIGLFAMVALLLLFLGLYVMPPHLVEAWPTQRVGEVTFVDRLRLASFISTIAILTGSVAAGFDKLAVIRHLALFLDEP